MGAKNRREMNELESDPSRHREDRLRVRIASTSKQFIADDGAVEDGDVDVCSEEARGGEVTPEISSEISFRSRSLAGDAPQHPPPPSAHAQERATNLRNTGNPLNKTTMVTKKSPK